jgi:hypothetical protein
MADKYVDYSVAGPGTGTLIDPYKTILSAIGDVGLLTGNTVWIKGGTDDIENAFIVQLNKNITFEGYTTTPGDGGQATLTLTGNSATSLIRLHGATCLNSTFTFKNIIFNGNASATKFINQDTSGGVTGVSVILQNVIFNGTATTAQGLIIETQAGTAGRTVSISKCTLTSVYNSITDAASISIIDSTFSAATTAIIVGGLIGSFIFKNNTVTVSVNYCLYALGLIANTTGEWIVDSNNFINTSNHCIYFDRYIQDLKIINNKLLCALQTGGIIIGADAATSATPLGTVIIAYNYITWPSGIEPGHAILCGSGTNGIKCYNNIVYTTYTSGASAVGIVIKSESGSCYNNNLTIPRPILVKGGQNNKIYNNICTCTGTYAPICFVYDPNNTNPSSDNIVLYNVFSGGTDAVYMENDMSSGNRFDYNILVSGSVGLLRDISNSGTYTTLPAVVAAWRALDADCTWRLTNDTHSSGKKPADIRNRNRITSEAEWPLVKA